jgi:hypothetical protein
MAYSETDRTYIRRYCGFGAIFIQAEPRLENAILATQSQADGGTRPDSSTENYIKGLVYGYAAVTSGTAGVTPGPTDTTGTVFNTPGTRGLLQIEQNIANLDAFMGATSVDSGEAQVDSAREGARLRKEGRRLAGMLARMLGMKGVRMDVFSAAPVIDDSDPFAYSDIEHWRGGP